MIEGLRFQDPIWLLLIVVVFALDVLAHRRRRRYAVLYSSLEGLHGLPVTLAQRVKKLLPPLRLAGLSLLVAALARPQQGREEYRIRTEGIAMQLVVDRSGSMEALDFTDELGVRQDRLTVVKEVIRDFVAGDSDLPGRPDDLLGLVVFGGYAEGRCPLTLDHGALLSVLETVEIPQEILDARGRVLNKELLREERATAIGDALALAVERLRDSPAKSTVAILLSDGESNAGVITPMEAANAAKAFGVKVYTIGVGSTGRAPVRVKDVFGRDHLDFQLVRLDEATLKAIAEETGGRYFNAKDTSALRDVYATIDTLEKTETEGLLYTEYRELFASALVAGILLVLLELLLAATRFRTLP